ncbi:hypothetical protein O3M35_009634 [Rhynocoris fuscipes]|uniref:Centrobin n=1 Tax=Rhynocoris fuscipes TaxID=488301 RepID=A0AAW1DAM5_9HEMI
MSDSDDTDVLLLIPPNFFLVHSDQESDSDIERNSERLLVGNLISHVNSLENRVNHIENITSNGCKSSLSDYDSKSLIFNDVSEYSVNKVTSNLVFGQDLNNKIDFNLSTPIYTLNTQANWNNREIQQIESNLFAENIYNGINMDKYSAIDSLFQNGSPTKRLALPEVDKLLKEMETTQSEIENRLRSREIEHGILDKGKNPTEVISRNVYTMGDNIGSIPDRGFGVRDMFSSNNSLNNPFKSGNNNKDLPLVEEPCIKRDAYLVGSSNGDSDIRKSLTSLSLSRSPMKDFNSPTKVSLTQQDTRRKNYLSPRRRLQMNSDGVNSKTLNSKSYQENRSELTEERLKGDTGGAGDSQDFRFKPDGGYSSKVRTLNNPRGNLLSLAELWRSESDINTDDPSKLKQKLEEEKYRRLHLENTVQTLQRRVLEEQEKVAVAMKVDEGKDRAIGQITEAWKQMVHHWRDIEAERHAMSQTLINERSEIAKQREDIEKKIERWEKEMSQALDLAAGYKAKFENIEKEYNSLKENAETKVKELEETLETRELVVKELKEERQSLSERLQVSKNEHEEEKRLLESSRRDVSMLQEQLSKCEAELTVVKEQRDLLSMRLKEEKSRSSMLDAQKKALSEALDAANDKIAKLEEEIKNASSSMEKNKSELRALYQSQLEAVVRDKVNEFQAQLDRAQVLMQAELENTRRLAEETSQRQQQALVNSHIAEMRRLESIHKDELRAIESKLAESERRRARLENGKKDIAQRLHGVMESQWRQALNIITSELSMKQEVGSKIIFLKYDNSLGLKMKTLHKGNVYCIYFLGISYEWMIIRTKVLEWMQEG